MEWFSTRFLGTKLGFSVHTHSTLFYDMHYMFKGIFIQFLTVSKGI